MSHEQAKVRAVIAGTGDRACSRRVTVCVCDHVLTSSNIVERIPFPYAHTTLHMQTRRCSPIADTHASSASVGSWLATHCT